MEYNDEESMKEMNLVLFNDALEHLTKISRIIRTPRLTNQKKKTFSI